MHILPPTLAKARARLVVHAPFYGSMALGLRWQEDATLPTMATDGRAIFYNRAWCDKIGSDKCMGVIAHEVLHVVNKHHLRRRERDPKLWNIAADLVINTILQGAGYPLPEGGVFDTQGEFAGLWVETVYARLETRAGRRQDGEFMLGLATRIAQVSDAMSLPHVRERLAEMIITAELMRSCLRAAEADAASRQMGRVHAGARAARRRAQSVPAPVSAPGRDHPAQPLIEPDGDAVGGRLRRPDRARDRALLRPRPTPARAIASRCTGWRGTSRAVRSAAARCSTNASSSAIR